MAKHPTIGRVKTRLAESLGHREATNLYQCFLEDMIKKLRSLTNPFFIYFTPNNKKEDFEQLFGNDLTYVPQIGDDLGEKLNHGFETSMKMGYNSAIALASDIPDLPDFIINEAIQKLKVHDSVIGPSIDGGYYLIGLRKNAFTETLFKGITWSTDKVYGETIKQFENMQISYHSLPPWNDVDTIEDLKSLFNSRNPSFNQSQTWKYLKKSHIIQNIFYQVYPDELQKDIALATTCSTIIGK